MLKFISSSEVVSGISHIQHILEHIYQKYKNFDDGEVATYIPELAKANPQHFGICLASVDGRVIHVGDWEQEFTIQSICKPFAFQMALEKFGRDTTLKHVGVEPSGEAFNSIELDPKTMRPFNAMINVGARPHSGRSVGTGRCSSLICTGLIVVVKRFKGEGIVTQLRPGSLH